MTQPSEFPVALAKDQGLVLWAPSMHVVVHIHAYIYIYIYICMYIYANIYTHKMKCLTF